MSSLILSLRVSPPSPCRQNSCAQHLDEPTPTHPVPAYPTSTHPVPAYPTSTHPDAYRSAVTVFASKLVGDLFNHGIYDTLIHSRGTPLLVEHELEFHQKMVAHKLNVGDLRTRRVVALPPVVTLADLCAVLAETSHASFPITYEVVRAAQGEDFALCGAIQRDTLMQMIERRVGWLPADGVKTSASPSDYEEAVNLQEMLEQVATKTSIKKEPHILESIAADDLDAFVIDLRPFMQRSPLLLQQHASYARAYQMFRAQGPTMVFVTPNHPRVQGIITRKDLTPENAALFLMDKAVEEGFLPEDFHRRYHLGDVKAQPEALRKGAEMPMGPLGKNIPFIPDDDHAPLDK